MAIQYPTNDSLKGRQAERCRFCGAIIMPLKNKGSREGSICSENCRDARIMPAMKKEDAARSTWLLRFGFPDATERPGGWVIEDMPGKWELVDEIGRRRKWTKPPRDPLPKIKDHECFGLIAHCLHIFTRVT